MEKVEIMDNGLIFLFVIMALLILFIIFCIRQTIKMRKARKQNKINNQINLNERNAAFSTQLKHFNGLALSEGALTWAYWCNDKIQFEANGICFNLPLDKITDISMKSDVEIQKQYVSSAGGAVAGAVMFGALGAMIGGRTKEKTSTQVTQYLIFTYVDNNEVKYIAFECIYASKPQQFVNAFKTIKPSTTQSFNL